MILAPFDIIADVLQDNLGVPSYVVSVLLGLLILSIILAVFSLLKVGI
jgi:hypothetical protein